MSAKKSEAERLLAAREADVAQLQQELAAAQQAGRSMPSMHATHRGQPGLQQAGWQMSISEAAAMPFEEQPSEAALKALVEDKRKLQVSDCILQG